MQFENNRCYTAFLHFAVSGTRLLSQQSPELLAKAASAQTALLGTKACSQTSPSHVTCLPCCWTDNVAKGVYGKGRTSTPSCKTMQDHRLHHQLKHHTVLSPHKPPSKQQASWQTRQLSGAVHNKQNLAAAVGSPQVVPLLLLHPYFSTVRFTPGCECHGFKLPALAISGPFIHSSHTHSRILLRPATHSTGHSLLPAASSGEHHIRRTSEHLFRHAAPLNPATVLQPSFP